MAEENLHAQCSSHLYSTGAHMISESQPSVSGISFVSTAPDVKATLSYRSKPLPTGNKPSKKKKGTNGLQQDLGMLHLATIGLCKLQ